MLPFWGKGRFVSRFETRPVKSLGVTYLLVTGLENSVQREWDGSQQLIGTGRYGVREQASACSAGVGWDAATGSGEPGRYGLREQTSDDEEILAFCEALAIQIRRVQMPLNTQVFGNAMCHPLPGKREHAKERVRHRRPNAQRVSPQRVACRARHQVGLWW